MLTLAMQAGRCVGEQDPAQDLDVRRLVVGGSWRLAVAAGLVPGRLYNLGEPLARHCALVHNNS